MPPFLALVFTFGLIAYLFRLDRKTFPKHSKAIWVPLVWVLIISSRFVSQWLNTGPTLGSPDAYIDGSPIDRLIFLALLIAGVLILRSRQVRLQRLITENPALALFLAYCLISILWSDYPFVAFKRWVKVVGHPVMALVLLTDNHPAEAVKAVFRRTAYVLMPLSVTLIKYYPGIGRGFSDWTGAAYNTGVTTNKNALGYLCLVVGIFLVWELFAKKTEPVSIEDGTRKRLYVLCFLLGVTLWLLYQANSGTSLLCFLIGCGVLLLARSKFVRKRRHALGAYLVLAIVFASVLEVTLGLSDSIIVALGRDVTLTGRTELWDDVVRLATSPVFGTGFESFWLGPRARLLWDKYWWHPNQAHNGYLETYINLGWVGLSLLLVALLAGYRKASVAYRRAAPFGDLWLSYILVIFFYNLTEATFKALHVLFFVFFLVVLDCPRKEEASPPPSPSASIKQRSIQGEATHEEELIEVVGLTRRNGLG